MKSCLPCVPHTSGGLELALHHTVLPATGSPRVTSPWDGLRLYPSFLSTLKMFGFGQALSFSPCHSKVPAMSLFWWILNWVTLWWAEQGVQSCNCTWRAAGIREGFICTVPSFFCTVPSCRAAWVFCEMGVTAARAERGAGLGGLTTPLSWLGRLCWLCSWSCWALQHIWGGRASHQSFAETSPGWQHSRCPEWPARCRTGQQRFFLGKASKNTWVSSEQEVIYPLCG